MLAPRARSYLRLSPVLAEPQALSSTPEERAQPPGRAIDPEVATSVPSPPAPPIPAPVIDPQERQPLPRPAISPPPSEPSEPKRGLGLLIPGAGLIVPGTLLTVIGFRVRQLPADWLCFEGCEDRANEPNPYSGALAFTLAGITFAVSAALLTVGGLRAKEWRKWEARQPPPPPPSLSPPSQKKGIGMMIAGASLAGPAAAYFIVLGRPGAGSFAGDPFRVTSITFGGLFAVAGITLLAIGARRNVKYKRGKPRQAFVPTTGRTPHGTWTVGVALRF